MPDFPSWWTKDGLLKLFGSFQEVPEGWERCSGTYDTQTGQWVEASNPFDHDGDGKPGGSKPGPRKRRKRKA